MTDVFSSCMLLYSLSRTTDLYELPAAFLQWNWTLDGYGTSLYVRETKFSFLNKRSSTEYPNLKTQDSELNISKEKDG